MIQLPNDCYCSDLTVYPSNWNEKGASLKKDWYIQYYFHDPQYRDHPKLKYGKLRIVKGMNSYKSLSERRDATRRLMDYELQLLKVEGFNPITGTFLPALQLQHEIEPSTPFVQALEKAKEKLGVDGSTLKDINSMLTAVGKAAKRVRLVQMPVSEMRRKHIKYLLEDISKFNPKFSGHGFNKYRSYLMSLFKELVELEAIDSNPVRDISKKKVTKKLRQVLTNEERILIDKHLRSNYYSFWRFMQVFFHSGGREIELLAVKVKGVDLVRQRYTSIIKKGRQYVEVERTIKDVAVPLWREAIEHGHPEDYVFSIGLKPGEKMILRDQITRRWRVHVKEKLGIDKDFYALKHLNLDETAALLSAADAAKQAGHTTPVITIKHYLVNEGERQHEKLRKVNNTFV